MDLTMKDKVLGSLVGFAIGDAMGATTEFMNKQKIAKVYGRVENIMGGGWLRLPKGKTTDDTGMMLCVLDAMDQAGIFEFKFKDMDKSSFAYSVASSIFLDVCCDNFKAWFLSNPVDVGAQCSKVIEAMILRGNRLENYASWRKVAKSDTALGNGGLMRCLPLALLGGKIGSDLAKYQNDLTHNNKDCDFEVNKYCRLVDNFLAGNIPSLKNMLRMEPTGHVTNTLHNAAYWASTSSSFEEAIISAVNDGGDADTIAALTGGLVGAYYGYSAIPTKWLNDLDQNVLHILKEYANKY